MFSSIGLRPACWVSARVAIMKALAGAQEELAKAKRCGV